MKSFLHTFSITLFNKFEFDLRCARAHLYRTWYAQVDRIKFTKLKSLRLHAIYCFQLVWTEMREKKTFFKITLLWLNVRSQQQFVIILLSQSLFVTICCCCFFRVANKKRNEWSSMGFLWTLSKSLFLFTTIRSFKRTWHAQNSRHDHKISMNSVVFAVVSWLLLFRNLHTKWMFNGFKFKYLSLFHTKTDSIEQNRARSKTSLNYSFSISFAPCVSVFANILNVMLWFRNFV